MKWEGKLVHREKPMELQVWPTGHTICRVFYKRMWSDSYEITRDSSRFLMKTKDSHMFWNFLEFTQNSSLLKVLMSNGVWIVFFKLLKQLRILKHWTCVMGFFATQVRGRVDNYYDKWSLLRVCLKLSWSVLGVFFYFLCFVIVIIIVIVLLMTGGRTVVEVPTHFCCGAWILDCLALVIRTLCFSVGTPTGSATRNVLHVLGQNWDFSWQLLAEKWQHIIRSVL